MSQWYAVRSATRRERKAAEALAAAGVTVFLPLETRWGTRHGQLGRVRVEGPLLPGYIFVLIDVDAGEDEAWRAILDIEYVHGVLGCEGDGGVTKPLPIPLAMILEIQADERAGSYDRTLQVKVKYQPQKGDRIKVVAGPWLSFLGKVLSTPTKERVHVMIEGPYGRGAQIEKSHLARVA